MTIIRFYELNDDEIFNMTSISDININADLTAVIILSYKLNFKFIKLSFKLNSEINYALSHSLSS